MTAISGPSVTASFQYDALGRRKSKTVNGVTTEFLYDGHSSVQELSGGSVQANLLLGLGIDEVLQRTEISSTSHFPTDGLGSTLALTDSAGAIQTEYTYEPFGNTTTSGASSANPSQYTGRENDGTGLYYYRARYYHPGLHRFISQDPIGFAGRDVNLYVYVGNSPVDGVDPLGLAQFGKRPLEGMPFMLGGDSHLNLGLFHEQLFFEDGTNDNVGLFKEGPLPDDPANRSQYERFGPHYDDDLMRDAVKNVPPGCYDSFLNNCQDYADKLRREYERLKRERDFAPDPDPDNDDGGEPTPDDPPNNPPDRY